MKEKRKIERAKKMINLFKRSFDSLFILLFSKIDGYPSCVLTDGNGER